MGKEDDICIGFAFCVTFEHLQFPLYLSFESENVEECFHMPRQLELDKNQGSELKHLWLIYISRPHCHFVETGACISFKSHSGSKVTSWGIRTILDEDLDIDRPLHIDRHIDMIRGQDYFPYEDVDESCSKISGPKIKLPYNWLVTEKDECEKMEAEEKENNISNVGLSKDQLQ